MTHQAEECHRWRKGPRWQSRPTATSRVPPLIVVASADPPELTISPPPRGRCRPQLTVSEWRKPVGIGNQWDQTKPLGRAQEAPFTLEYQAIFEASLADIEAGGQGNDAPSRCVPFAMPRVRMWQMPISENARSAAARTMVAPRLVADVLQQPFCRKFPTDTRGFGFAVNQPADG
jgi:hypothetical protein